MTTAIPLAPWPKSAVPWRQNYRIGWGHDPISYNFQSLADALTSNIDSPTSMKGGLLSVSKKVPLSNVVNNTDTNLSPLVSKMSSARFNHECVKSNAEEKLQTSHATLDDPKSHFF